MPNLKDVGNERLVETDDQAMRHMLTVAEDGEHVHTEDWRDRMNIPEILAFVGTGLVAVAYIPSLD